MNSAIEINPQVKIYNRNFHLRNAVHLTLQQQHEQAILTAANTPKITTSSYHILTRKLESQLHSTMIKYKDTLTFDEFEQVMQCFFNASHQELQIISGQLWLILNNYQIENKVVSNSKVEALLRIILDPYTLPPSQVYHILNSFDQFKEIKQKRKEFINQHPQLTQQTMKIKNIISMCYKMRSNHQNNKTYIHQQKYPFQPKINEQSKILAAHSLQKYISEKRLQFISCDEVPYHEILHHRRLQKDYLSPKCIEVSPLKSKTATAEQIKQITNNLYVKQERRIDADWRKTKEEKELQQECSFKPQTTHYTKSKSIHIVKNFQTNVQRLHKGREMKENLKQIYQNMGKIKQTQRNSVAPSFIKRDQPKLILEVKIGNSRVEKIKLKGDEDAKIVAKKFVTKHDLDTSMQSVLEDLIQQHLESL